MPTGVSHYEFGAFRVEPGERRLSRNGGQVAIPPKAFDLLVILVEHPGRLLRKEDLIERLWPGVFVEEVNLAQNVSTIRRALGGDGRETFIQTVPGAGYRFVAAQSTRWCAARASRGTAWGSGDLCRPGAGVPLLRSSRRVRGRARAGAAP
jgi:DNA-binding winged helix-turn-helix (wHTH) protein